MNEVFEEGIELLDQKVEMTPRRSTRISRTLNNAGPSPYVPDLVRRSRGIRRSRSRSAKKTLNTDKDSEEAKAEDNPVAPCINIIPCTPITVIVNSKENATPTDKDSEEAKAEDNPVAPCINLIPCTPITVTVNSKENATPTNMATSSSKTRSYRQNSTPYKPLQPIDNIDDGINNISIDIVNNKILSSDNVILKSIRKRSISLSERPRTTNRVTFRSPSNSSIIIDRIDEIMRSNTKSRQDEYVTKRRKRSLSFSEIEYTSYAMDSENVSKLLPNPLANHRVGLWRKEILNEKSLKDKELVQNTPEKKSRLPAPISRTKLPNFAAIHSNHFSKMESINDHLTRKAERAKILTSASKPKNASAQKSKDTNATLHEIKNLKKVETQARKKIDLSGVTLLPNPKMAESLSISLMGRTKKVLSSSKPKLNSTTVVAFGSTIAYSDLSQKNEDKFAQRQKRIADLYKGRKLDKTKEGSNKKREIIRGVRSNRRFELQMESRNRRME